MKLNEHKKMGFINFGDNLPAIICIIVFVTITFVAYILPSLSGSKTLKMMADRGIKVKPSEWKIFKEADNTAIYKSDVIRDGRLVYYTLRSFPQSINSLAWVYKDMTEFKIVSDCKLKSFQRLSGNEYDINGDVSKELESYPMMDQGSFLTESGTKERIIVDKVCKASSFPIFWLIDFSDGTDHFGFTR